MSVQLDPLLDNPLLLGALRSALVKPKYANLRNSCDRYGASYLIAQSLGLKRIPYSFGDWLHGWIYWNIDIPEELKFDPSLASCITHIVNSYQHAELLEQYNFRNVRLAPLPFFYTTTPQHQLRIPKTLLVFPAHSSESEKVPSISSAYLDYLADSHVYYDTILISLYPYDYDPDLICQLGKRKIRWIKLVHPCDLNSLQRLRNVLSIFSDVTANCISSPLLYAVASGANVKIDPLAPWQPHIVMNENELCTSRRKYYEKLRYVSEQRYAIQNFPFFFSQNPANNQIMREWYASIQTDTISPRCVAQWLGWFGPSKQIHYLRAFLRRTRRFFSPSLSWFPL